MKCPNCDGELNQNGTCEACGYGMEESNGELCLAPKHAKRCVNCGIECDERAEVCLGCGYSFVQRKNEKKPNLNATSTPMQTKNAYVTAETVLMARVILVLWAGLSAVSLIGSLLS